MDVALPLLLVALGGYLLALATLPRWCFMTINRSQIWRLRDSIERDMRQGSLPHHPAVMHLRDEVSRSLEVLPMLTPGVMKAVLAQVSPSDLQAARAAQPSVDGLAGHEIARLRGGQERLLQLVARSMVLNTWSGVFAVASTALASVVQRDEAALRTIYLYRGWEVRVRLASRISAEIDAAETVVDSADGPNILVSNSFASV